MRGGGNEAAILPGAVLGVLGGGQLGRMFALAARAMGYRIHIYSPEYDAPAGQVADVEVVADFGDHHRMREFARGVQVATFEFENVPVAAAEVAEEHTRVRPAGRVLHITQQRLREKTFLERAGFPVTPFRAVRTREDLLAGAAHTGLPAILKTADFGYDGKGQARVRTEEALLVAWEAMRGVDCILEAVVDFEKELSVVGARSPGGAFAAFPVFENRHANHILDVTSCPAGIDARLEGEAIEMSRAILEALDVTGLLTVELFLDRRGRLLVNELAPRPHNSGHLTIDAMRTSQFEQQLRAICGLPLGDTGLLRPAAMANLLGDVWTEGEPDWASALSEPGLSLHLYGKAEPRPGRKMGHLTALGESVELAVEAVVRARARLSAGRGRP